MSALQLFGTAAAPEEDINVWNASDGWREEYGQLADGLFAFAQEVFGGQFVVSSAGFEYFNLESAQRRPMGEDLETWAATLLSDWRYWTGSNSTRNGRARTRHSRAVTGSMLATLRAGRRV